MIFGSTRNFTLVSSKANLKAGPSAVSLKDQLTSDSKLATPHDFWFNSKFHLSQLQCQSQEWSLSCQSERSTDLRFELSDPIIVKIDTPPAFWSNSKFHLSQLKGQSKADPSAFSLRFELYFRSIPYMIFCPIQNFTQIFVKQHPTGI
jgi:hypothetical protein